MKTTGIIALTAIGMVLATHAAEPTGAPKQAAAGSSDDLYDVGKQLFDQLAPDEIKAQYEFPSKSQWDDFAARLQRALDGNSLAELGGYRDEARTALVALRALPDYADFADWLEQRLDEIDGAQEIARAPQPPTKTPAPPRAPPSPKGASGPPSVVPTRVPYYDFWLTRVRSRPIPAQASTLMPRLRSAFAAEGVPPELAWLAEAESSLNPSARSPAGAKGLFQLMPETAHTMGLGTFLPDERGDPDKSARAAARYLRTLHARFGDWPLALAAYNAGEGRVSRAVAARRAHDFAGAAAGLPAETRMYVPKVCALVQTRTGTPIEALDRR